MVKKIILICLAVLLNVVSLSSPVWALSSTPVWIAQMETPTPTVPSEQPKTKLQTNKTKPSTEPTIPEQTTVNRRLSAQKQSQTKPFNPYDMKALKQFDAGDHRAQ